MAGDCKKTNSIHGERYQKTRFPSPAKTKWELYFGKSLLINPRRARITLKWKGSRWQSNTRNLSSIFWSLFLSCFAPSSPHLHPSPTPPSYPPPPLPFCSSYLRKKIRCWSNTWKLSPFISCSSTFFRSQQLLIPATWPKLGAKLFPALRANKAITPWSTKKQTIWDAEYKSH